MRRYLAGLLMVAGVVVAADARAGILDYKQQRFIARGSNALRAGPFMRNDADSVRQPYPPRFYQDTSRGIEGCGWMMRRAIDTNNRNWLQRYRGCAQ